MGVVRVIRLCPDIGFPLVVGFFLVAGIALVMRLVIRCSLVT